MGRSVGVPTRPFGRHSVSLDPRLRCSAALSQTGAVFRCGMRPHHGDREVLPAARIVGPAARLPAADLPLGPMPHRTPNIPAPITPETFPAVRGGRPWDPCDRCRLQSLDFVGWAGLLRRVRSVCPICCRGNDRMFPHLLGDSKVDPGLSADPPCHPVALLADSQPRPSRPSPQQFRQSRSPLSVSSVSG